MSRQSHREDGQKKGTGWDYSSHPLKDGGMQIFLCVVSAVAIMLAPLLLVLWLWLSPQGTR